MPVIIKKPKVGDEAPEWLKTMMGILSGRRKNAIVQTKEETLTFSATPTKAELESLYLYTNKLRKSLEDFISRFDT